MPDPERRAAALRGELERLQQESAAAVHALHLERAVLQERLAASEHRATSPQVGRAAPGKQGAKRAGKTGNSVAPAPLVRPPAR